MTYADWSVTMACGGLTRDMCNYGNISVPRPTRLSHFQVRTSSVYAPNTFTASINIKCINE